MKMLIGIPAYNEESVLPGVLKALPGKLKGISSLQVLVVDDGSSDKTGVVADKKGVLVARHLLNRGLGGALKTILEYAKTEDFDFLVTMDADGQHDSGDLPDLIKPVLQKKADVVIGSRWKKQGKAPVSRVLINKLANYFTFIFFGVLTSDSQSGLRAFNRNAIAKINIQTDGMEVSSEIIREIKIHKLNLVEVPVTVIYTGYSQNKGQRLENAPNVFLQLLLRILRS